MLYQTGQSRARPYTVGVDSGDILLADKQGNVLDVLKPSEWDLQLDRIEDDHLILQDLSRGQRLVCDIGLLDELIESVDHVRMQAQAKNLKKEIRARAPNETSATALLGVLVFAFLAWLGFGYPMAMNAYKTQLANAPAIIRMTASEQEDYVRGASNIIQRRWKPPVCDEDRASTVRFDVEKDGRATNVRIVKSSGDGSFDEKAKACVRTGQFNPLPEAVGSSVPLEFTFSYKIPSYSDSPDETKHF